MSNNNTGYSNTGYSNTGYRNTGSWNTGDSNTGCSNTGYSNTGNCNTGYHNTGYSNTGDRNTGSWNTGGWNTGYSNTGDKNTGSWNTGSWNSGLFNTNQPKMRIFNKVSEYTNDQFLDANLMPSMLGFKLTIPVDSVNMTNKEKADNPNYKTTGSYLKKLEYKEAWAIFWKETSEENRQKFLNLPNFDAEIFEEITGVKVNEQNEVVEVTMDEIAEKMGIDIKNLRIKDE